MTTVPIARRTFLAAAGGLLTIHVLPRTLARAAASKVRLVAAPTSVRLVGPAGPATPVWTYNGQVPGPLLRFGQGERAVIEVENRLPQPTSMHWHGLRVPNAMDGVPHLTQAPIAPGETFTYEFDVADAGTYWYHPHANSAEQVGRGLAGVLIVDERHAPAVDRDLLWVLGDWRLDGAAQIRDDFGHPHDISHAGRLGNTVTLNGVVPDEFSVRAGERLRLRLVNVANARLFGLRFSGHRPWLIARDGQPVDPAAPREGRVELGPGERVDLILDCLAEPGERLAVIDDFYPRQAYRLIDLAYRPDPPLRSAAAQPLRLADNPWPRPDVEKAKRVELVIGGGAMGQMRVGRLDGESLDARALFQRGKAWALNGEVAGDHHAPPPFLTLQRGESAVLALVNDTAFHHPMHLHGMFFEVLAVDGELRPTREGRDTLTLAPRGRALIAFRADSPGDWMFHCHVLEHQDAGLAGIVRVA